MSTARLAHPVPLALTAALLAGSLTAQAAAAKRTHLALLVGIDRYAQPDEGQWHTLRGCENDVQLVREVLIERFGFRDEDIVTLPSEKATHAAIVKAFHDHLVKQATADTKVVFWFSGHGSQVPDPTQKDRAESGDEEPPKDQTMLAHDSRQGARNGRYDLSDDEVHSLLAAVKARDVLFVSDCCHSGGLARGGEELHARGEADGKEPLDVETLKRQGVWPKDLPLLEDDGEGRLLPHVVHVAACAADEEAGEIETARTVHGTLTWFLCQVLREVPASTSWRVVVETVRARIAGRMGSRPSQFVDVHGPEDRPVLGGTAREVPPGYLVEATGAGRLRVHAGTVHGIGSQTVFELRDLDGKTVAQASPESVRSASTDLTPKGSVPYGRALWAVPVAGLEGRPLLTVSLPADLGADRLRGSGFVAAAAGTPADYEVRRIGTGLEIRDRNGELAGTAAQDSELATVLFKEGNFRYLWDAVGARGEYPLELRVGAASAEQCLLKVDGKDVRVAPAKLGGRGKAQRVPVEASALDDSATSGGMAALVVENRSDQDLHVAVLSVQEDRAVTLVFGHDRNNLVRAKGSRTARIQVGPSATWRRDRPMIDRYVAFATVRWVDFSVFERTAPAATRGGEDEAPPSLFALLDEGERTRGGDAKKPWGLAWLDLELTTPGAKGAKPSPGKSGRK